MSITELPRKSNDATATELAETSVKSLGDVLDSIRDGVLVIAGDIPDEQRAEILRELALMDVMNDRARNALGLPKVPRSMHLQRDERQS